MTSHPTDRTIGWAYAFSRRGVRIPGFWYCRDLNKWPLVVVTLLFGVSLGADIIVELIDGEVYPVLLTAIGLLSVSCVVLLWVSVTRAAAVGLVMLALSLSVEGGFVYSLMLSLLLTGVTAMAATKLFRRTFLIAWCSG